MSDAELLKRPACCLAWATPMGGLQSLAEPPRDGSPIGVLRRQLRAWSHSQAGRPIAELDAAAYAEAERLAASIARIAFPRIAVRWADSRGAAGLQPGQVVLDRRLLAARHGWDLPHRVDALMGMTLRDAAHAARTPRGFHAELADVARRSGLFPSDTAAETRSGLVDAAAPGGPGRSPHQNGKAVSGGPLSVRGDGHVHANGHGATSSREADRQPPDPSTHRAHSNGLSSPNTGTDSQGRPTAPAHEQLHANGTVPTGRPLQPLPIIPDDVFAPLLALFLLVEAHHVDTWLNSGFPGFHSYIETVWTWRIPDDEVARRFRALRGRLTFGALLSAAVSVVVGRATAAAAPPSARPLLDAISNTIAQIGAETPPTERYHAAVALTRLLRDLFQSERRDTETGQPGPSAADERRPDETQRESPDTPPTADELQDRQAALEAMMAIALDGLDPSATREGLSPEREKEVDGLNGHLAHRRSAGDDLHAAHEQPQLLAQHHVKVPGARPMTMITPAITASARVRYDASYERMRGQAAVLRQLLQFRLTERRHAIYAQTSGQLDEQGLYRLPLGDQRVFLRRSIESAPDQDLCILLDESASMGPGQSHVRATIVLFHHALHGLPGVRHWVFGFSGYGRGIALYRYISPTHPDLQRPQRLGAVTSREATPLAEAVAGAAEAMLAEGRGRDKLLIIVTDGQPDDAGSARKALRAAESRGVSIIGLGIAADAAAASALFSHFTLYDDLETLPRKIGAILRHTVGASR